MEIRAEKQGKKRVKVKKNKNKKTRVSGCGGRPHVASCAPISLSSVHVRFI